MDAPPTDTAFSTDAILVPASNGWVEFEFGATPVDLTAGVGSVIDALTNTTALRLFDAVAPAFPGKTIEVELGADDIAAIPAPGMIGLLAGAVGGLLLARRRMPEK